MSDSGDENSRSRPDTVGLYRGALLYTLHMIRELIDGVEELVEEGAMTEREPGPPGPGESAAILANPQYRDEAMKIFQGVLDATYDGYSAYDVGPSSIEAVHGVLKDYFWKLDSLGDDWICIKTAAAGSDEIYCGCLGCRCVGHSEAGAERQTPQ